MLCTNTNPTNFPCSLFSTFEHKRKIDSESIEEIKIKIKIRVFQGSTHAEEKGGRLNNEIFFRGIYCIPFVARASRPDCNQEIPQNIYCGRDSLLRVINAGNNSRARETNCRNADQESISRSKRAPVCIIA